MQISDEGKARFMVIPIVAMLVVTMVVAGCLEEEQVEIDVEEYPGELTIKHLNESDDETGVVGTLPEKNETAETIVNDESQLRLEIDPQSIIKESGSEQFTEQFVRLDFQIFGDLDEEFDLDTLRIEVAETPEDEPSSNGIDFLLTDVEIEGGERWPEEDFPGGLRYTSPDRPAYVGFDLTSNEFMTNGSIQWTFRSENIGEDFTLQLQAIVDGNISEEVVSTVELHIEGND